MIDVIDMVDMMVVPREIWSAVTRAALRAGRGTAFWLAYIKAASRGIPLAAALQIQSPDLRSTA